MRAIVAAVVGFGYPYLELAWKCRAGAERSEACVWGRAYMPASRWIEPLIVAPLVFGALTLIAHLWRRRT